jgi:hypothetical protein
LHCQQLAPAGNFRCFFSHMLTDEVARAQPWQQHPRRWAAWRLLG